MAVVLINTKIKPRKQTEFFQTIESIKGLLTNKCNNFNMDCKNNKNVKIKISFDDADKMEESFRGVEFDILKGALFSLCDNIEIIKDEKILIKTN